MNLSGRWKIFAAVFAGVCVFSNAQEPTFKAQAPLVVVPVTVSSPNGENIWELKEGDFQLFDNGIERKITVEPWSTYQSQISLVVVIQTSSLSKAALLKVKKIAALLDNITGEGGEVAVITADSEVQTRLPFARQWEPIQETFEKLKPSGSGMGRMLDGVDAAIDLLAQKPQGQRRLVLLISEVTYRGTKAKAEAVITHAQQQNVTIYAATYSAYITPFTTKASELEPDDAEGMNLLALFTQIAQAAKQNAGKTLAQYTGGRQLSFNTLHHLEDDLSEIGKDVHSQYQLSFVPPPERIAIYHALTIKIKEHPDAVVRARPGYWSGAVLSEPLPR